MKDLLISLRGTVEGLSNYTNMDMESFVHEALVNLNFTQTEKLVTKQATHYTYVSCDWRVYLRIKDKKVTMMVIDFGEDFT